MSNQEELIVALKTNIAALKAKFEQEKASSVILHKEVSELEKRLKAKETSYLQLEAKYNTLRVARSLVGNTEEAHQAKLKVNTVVREIDKCIALLNR